MLHASLPVRVVLDGVEPSVPGLRVQVFDDERGPALAVENDTGRTLEVLGEDGRPFVRVDAAGVAADVAHPSWYRSLSPGGAPMPADAREAPPTWRHVRAESAWQWFDPRLDRRAGRPGAQWRVPLRLEGEAVEVRGRFVREATTAGAFETRMTSPAELAPQVTVELAPGRPPTLTLQNGSRHDVVVLGRHGEPFLRIRIGGADANLISPTWQDLRRYLGLADEVRGVAGEGAVRWECVSLAPHYTWLEPRAAMPSIEPFTTAPDNTRSKVKSWRVPMLIGAQYAAIVGVVEWVPGVPAGRAATH